MRSDGACVLMGAWLLIGQDTRFTPEANMYISFFMFQEMEQNQRKRGFMTLVPLDFSSRGHHFHNLDKFFKLDLTN